MKKYIYFITLTLLLLACNNSSEPQIEPEEKKLEISVINSGVGSVNAVAISRTSELRAWGGSEKHVKLSGVSDLKSHLGSITCLDFSYNENYLLSGSSDHLIKLWDVNTGDLITTFSEHLTRNWSIKFLRDGNNAISGQDEHVIIWSNIRTGPIGRLAMFGHIGRVNSVDISPDESKILSASHDGTIKIWNMSGDILKSLNGHNGIVYCAAYSPIGDIIVSGGADSTIILWDGNTFEKFNTFEYHSASVRWVSFHPSGNYMASAGSDKIIYLVSIANGSIVNQLTGHSKTITKIKFSGDGNTLISGSTDQTVRVWKNVFAKNN